MCSFTVAVVIIGDSKEEPELGKYINIIIQIIFEVIAYKESYRTIIMQ